MAAAIVGAGALVLYYKSLKILSRQTEISENLIKIETKRDLLAYAVSGWISIETKSEGMFRTNVIGRINNPTFQPIYEVSGQILNLAKPYVTGTYREIVKFEFQMVRPVDDVIIHLPQEYLDEIRTWFVQTYGENSHEKYFEHLAKPLALRFQFRDTDEAIWERDIRGKLTRIS